MLISFGFVATASTSSYAQIKRGNSKPRVSPNATISQTIGTTVITLHYGRPGVKGRKIFGGLVPYNKVWRAGANEATAINFSKDVKVQGQSLKAGWYSLFMIPGKQEWTIIFNSTIKWGLDYVKKSDVLRVKATPEEAPMHEWLMYSFRDLKNNSANLVLNWDKTAVPITISTE
ncbi:MAG TPA: DUF2911 domain-containing protein [Balneolaceae bacterium]|nr:DUF2911 domain-containing protein [Balneolaceae bacterium]